MEWISIIVGILMLVGVDGAKEDCTIGYGIALGFWLLTAGALILTPIILEVTK